MPMLSRAEMEGAIRAKGVVMLPSGRIVHRIEDLPTEGDIAKQSGDPVKVKAAEDAIDLQIKSLQEAKAQLREKPAVPPEATLALEVEPAKEAPKPTTLGSAKVAPATVTVAPTQPAKPAGK